MKTGHDNCLLTTSDYTNLPDDSLFRIYRGGAMPPSVRPYMSRQVAVKQNFTENTLR